MKTIKERVVRALSVLEFQLLGFALLVPLLSTMAFICGGACELWQWWVAAWIVMIVGFVRRDWRDALVASGLFLCWMGVMWVLCGTLSSFGGYDEQAYHFPAVRLLADGWNPLKVRTVEQFTAAFGFDLNDMNYLHVLYQMKVVWIFNAVASKFTGDFFTPMLPFTLAVFPAAVIRLSRSVHPAWLRLLGMALLYWMMPRGEYEIDDVLTIGVVSLLLTMYATLADGKTRIAGMCAWTLIVTTTKLNGIIFAGVIWMLFLGLLFLRRIPWKRHLLTLSLAGAVFLPLTITPFITASFDCGHPLYPHCAGDGRHPAIDICADFLDVSNDDQKAMGRCGAFVNAYVSPVLACAYYRWRLDRPDFQPVNVFFKHNPNLSEDGGRTPIHWSFRFFFWSGALLLCVWGRSRGLFVVTATLICIASVPLRMVGYVRYVPWIMAPMVFVLVESCNQSLRKRLMILAGLVLTLFVVRPTPIQKQLYEAAHEIASSELMRAVLPGLEPPRVVSMGNFKWRANYELLRKRFCGLRDAEIVIEPKALKKRNAEKYGIFPGGHFCYERSDGTFATIERYRERMMPSPDRVSRYVFVFKVYSQVFPRLIARRLFGVPKFECEKRGTL